MIGLLAKPHRQLAIKIIVGITIVICFLKFLNFISWSSFVLLASIIPIYQSHLLLHLIACMFIVVFVRCENTFYQSPDLYHFYHGIRYGILFCTIISIMTVYITLFGYDYNIFGKPFFIWIIIHSVVSYNYDIYIYGVCEQAICPTLYQCFWREYNTDPHDPRYNAIHHRNASLHFPNRCPSCLGPCQNNADEQLYLHCGHRHHILHFEQHDLLPKIESGYQWTRCSVLSCSQPFTYRDIFLYHPPSVKYSDETTNVLPPEIQNMIDQFA